MIQPIETRYAGCRFRSRLEARWAVFFDHLGVEWQYEPQGFMVDWGGFENDEPEPYLPDFYLPALGTYVEVKGQITEPDLRKLVKAVIPHGQSLGAQGTPPLLILGDIPRLQPGLPSHHGLIFHKGDVNTEVYLWGYSGHLAVVRFDRYPHGVERIGNDSGWVNTDPEMIARLLAPGNVHTKSVRHGTGPGIAGGPQVIAAYTAARSARFEHGEAG